MCDVMTAITVGLGVMGNIQESKAASQAAKFNAQVASNNQVLAERQQKDALERGKEDELNLRRQVAGLKGTQRAAFGASGVALDSGSPADVLTDTAVLGELDALTVRQNAQREAYGYGIQATNFATEAAFQKSRAKSAKSMLPLTMATTIAGGASRYFDKNPSKRPWSTI